MDLSLAQSFVALEEEKKALEARIEEIKVELRQKEALLLTEMSRGFPLVRVASGAALHTLYVRKQVWVKARNGEAQMHRILTECGLGEFARLSYNSPGFKSYLLEAEKKGDVIPQRVLDEIMRGEVYTVEMRKA